MPMPFRPDASARQPRQKTELRPRGVKLALTNDHDPAGCLDSRQSDAYRGKP